MDDFIPPLPTPISAQTDFEIVLTPRNYQWELAAPGLNGENYICVAPTGTGKTLVAAMVIADHLQKNKGKENCHVVFIVTTRALAEQQTIKIKEYIPQVKVDVYSGDSDNMVADSLKENNVSVCTAGKLLGEIRQQKVKFSQLSMMVFDECHNTRKSHPYAELMKMYLERREEGEFCIQVIGMTASPGAGDNPSLDERKTIDHLLRLTALLDARGGIKTVQEYTREMQECSKTSNFTRKIMRSRDHTTDPFVAEVVGVMKDIETLLALADIKSCTFDKWSPGYETKIQQIIQPLEMSPKKDFRDVISGLKQLYGYCTALNVYMDLRAEDTIQAIENFSDIPQDDANATRMEIHLKRTKQSLLERLKSIPIMENPMLMGIQKIFIEKFREKSSRAILFVRTRKHTLAMKEWISQDPTLRELGISPGILTGHTSERGGSGMTKVEQKDAMKKFHDGEVNVLIATSVAEEGLDVPECNVVIRYQHVSDEIAKVQTEGRARAENSHGYTILSSSSRKKYQEMKNEELVQLVNKILEVKYFPSAEQLAEHIDELQRKIILEKMWKRQHQRRQQSCDGSGVKLFCKKCKEFACRGSDISTIGKNDTFHYVVHEESFKEKYTTRAHQKPRMLLPTIFKVHKVHCSKCESDWGVECFWPKGHLHPILKCKSFIFEVAGNRRPIKKWSSAPFKPEPLSSIVKLDSDDSDDD